MLRTNSIVIENLSKSYNTDNNILKDVNLFCWDPADVENLLCLI